MKYDLQEFKKRVEEGYLRKSEKGDLVLYGYTDRCTFARAWDKYTRIARGLILNKNTGEVIARPFSKFFNLGEMEETFLANLPNLPYEVFEKLDGSLGILFNYNGEWDVSTRGSFYSEQAAEAKEIMKDYNLLYINPNITLLAEIIYPQNKIIVSYGDSRKLVLLAAFNRDTGEELSREDLVTLCELTGMPIAPKYGLTIEQAIAEQSRLSKDEEGFVVRFENGLRVKIKGTEYLRIAKLMSSLSPIALWETMKDGKVDTTYLQQLPEELRTDYEPYVDALEERYRLVAMEVMEDFYKLPLSAQESGGNPTTETRKELGIFLKNNKVRHEGAMFPLVLGKLDLLTRYITKQIRPDGNEMKT